MAKASLTVTLIPGERHVGLWCEECALPSLVKQEVYSITRFGVSTMSIVFCTEHGRG